jgi:hypothetical protein
MHIWVDQICINQSDHLERSRQVTKMRHIYASADACLACLSSSKDHERSLFWLSQVEEKVRSQPFKFELIWDSTDSWFSERSTNDADMPNMMIMAEDNQDFFIRWSEMYEIFNLPWWRRAWVQQEFFVSNRVLFLCGMRYVLGKHLQFFLDLHNQVRQLRIKPGDTGFKFNDICFELPTDLSNFMKLIETALREKETIQFCETMIEGKLSSRISPRDLKSLLAHSMTCLSSDPRDKVYAFLGLCMGRYDIEPDYSSENTIERILVEVTKCIIETDNTLDILAHASILQGPGNDKLPSWVPNWISPKPSGSMFQEVRRIMRKTYDQQRHDDCLVAEFIMTSGEQTELKLQVAGSKLDWWSNSSVMGIYLENNVPAGNELWKIYGCDFPVLLQPLGDGEFRLAAFPDSWRNSITQAYSNGSRFPYSGRSWESGVGDPPLVQLTIM